MQAAQESTSTDQQNSYEQWIQSAQQSYQASQVLLKSDDTSGNDANQQDQAISNGPTQPLQSESNIDQDIKTLQNQDNQQKNNTSDLDPQKPIVDSVEQEQKTKIDQIKIEQKVLETMEQLDSEEQDAQSQHNQADQQNIPVQQLEEETKTQLPQASVEEINTNTILEEIKEPVAVVNPKRVQIESDLLLRARKLIENKEQLKVVQTQKKYDVTTRQTCDEQDCYVNYCEANCVPDIYPVQFQHLFDNWVEHGKSWQDYIRYSKSLCQEEGEYEIFQDKVKPGFPLSERNFISCVYKQPVESDGTVSILISGQDCEQYSDQIETKKDDVMGVIYLTYIRIEPLFAQETQNQQQQSDQKREMTGCKISWINSMTMGGSIPSGLQNHFGGKVMHKTVIECLKVVSKFDKKATKAQ